MMRLFIPLAVLLLFGWMFARNRRSWNSRVAIIASVPVGGLLGGYFGSAICYEVLRSQGGGESQNDAISMAAAGMAGFCIGAILLPLIAWLLTRKNKRDDKVA